MGTSASCNVIAVTEYDMTVLVCERDMEMVEKMY